MMPIDGGWPSVGVVIPTRGRPETLGRAVASVYAQDYPGLIEVAVVFDQEDPRPVPVTDDPNRRVTIVGNARTPGPSGARNAGVLALDTAFVAFLDDDDWWEPTKVARQVERILGAPGADVCTCGVVLEGRRRHVRRPPVPRVEAALVRHGRHVWLHTSTLLVRRQAFVDRIGLFDETIPAGYGEDLDWLLRAVASAPLVAERDVLVHVSFTGASWFQGRWPVVAEALQFQLARRPELSADPVNLARVQGRIAFAYAAGARSDLAGEWAARCRRTSWREPRSYLAVAVARRVVPASAIVRAAGWFGRGV